MEKIIINKVKCKMWWYFSQVIEKVQVACSQSNNNNNNINFNFAINIKIVKNGASQKNHWL